MVSRETRLARHLHIEEHVDPKPTNQPSSIRTGKSKICGRRSDFWHSRTASAAGSTCRVPWVLRWRVDVPRDRRLCGGIPPDLRSRGPPSTRLTFAWPDSSRFAFPWQESPRQRQSGGKKPHQRQSPGTRATPTSNPWNACHGNVDPKERPAEPEGRTPLWLEHLLRCGIETSNAGPCAAAEPRVLGLNPFLSKVFDRTFLFDYDAPRPHKAVRLLAPVGIREQERAGQRPYESASPNR